MPKKNGQPTKAEIIREQNQLKLNDEKFLSDNADLLNWTAIAKDYDLPDETLIKFSKYVKWGILTQYKQVSEDLILKYYKKMQCYNILKHQNINANIINHIIPEFKEYDWQLLSLRTLPFEIIEKYYLQLNLDCVDVSHLNPKEKERFDSLYVMKTLS